jgi:hypothetical protein
MRRAEQFRRTPFHIISPGGLFVTIGRFVRIALLHPLFREPHFIDFFTRFQASLGVGAFACVIFPDLIRERHRRGVSPRKIGHASRGAFVLKQALRSPIREIDHPRAAFAPAVIHIFILWQASAAMIAIIGNLMVELIRRGMELEHPLEPPTRFVQQVGDAVMAGLTLGVDDVFHTNAAYI